MHRTASGRGWCAAGLIVSCVAGLVEAGQDQPIQPAFNTVPGSALHQRSGTPFANDAALHRFQTRNNIFRPQDANATSTHGRYGHAAAFLPSLNTLLLIGGQVGASGTYITNDVVELNLDQPIRRATLSQIANPASRPDLSAGLPPLAWAAHGVDAADRIWLVGGVTEDCEEDAAAYTLTSPELSWQPVQPVGRRPPRRRQAAGVFISHDDSAGQSHETLHVFAGVAEQHTCSLETSAYLAIDHWSDNRHLDNTTVKTDLWKSPTYGAPIPPAVSDYAAFKLPGCHDGVVYLGGQDVSGKLLGMDTALLYNTTTGLWAQVVSPGSIHRLKLSDFCKNQHINGQAPSARLGHSMTVIGDGSVLLHGGIGAHNAKVTPTYILTPKDGNWTWSPAALDFGSEASPMRAWHSATSVSSNTVVVAFGLDVDTGKTSSDIRFLAKSATGGWKWSSENTLLKSAASDEKVVSSSKVVSYTFAEVSSAPSTSTYVVPDYNPYTNDPYTQTVSDAATPTPPGIFSQNNLGSADPAAQAASSRIVGGTIGGIAAFAAVAGAIGWWLRSKRNNEEVQSAGAVIGDQSEKAAEPVSQLLYTRKVPRRMLSLGSMNSTSFTADAGYAANNGKSSFRLIRPAITVTEFGGTAVDPAQPAPAIISTSMSDRGHNTGRDSVASYPFLRSVPINHGDSSSCEGSAESANGHGASMLARSQSMEGSDSDSSHGSDYSSDAPTPGLKVANKPAKELKIAEDPFSDFDQRA